MIENFRVKAGAEVPTKLFAAQPNLIYLTSHMIMDALISGEINALAIKPVIIIPDLKG
ncbi:hypothetical protein SOASR029_26390 [Budvicia aquatica]|nr:hypothetical protein SOASR029_26390 [Budvicia aquatica]